MPPSAAPLLARLTDARGRAAASWATAPLDGARRTLEVLPGDHLVVTSADGAGSTWMRGEPGALPLATDALDGLCLTAVLATAADVDVLFAEVRRVLRPAATLVVITPSATVRAVDQLPLRALHRDGWRHRTALDQAGWLLAAADFAVISDERRSFALDVGPGSGVAAVAQLAAAALWPPDPPARVVDRLAATDGRWPVPLRRLVARR